MEIEEFVNELDFEEYDYFYHENGKGVGASIMENGLFIEADNILETNNLLYTTSVPITPELVKDMDEFIAFLQREKSVATLREVSEMTIIRASKLQYQDIVAPYGDYFRGKYYQGVIDPQFIYGVIDLEELTFTPNEDLDYGDSFTR